MPSALHFHPVIEELLDHEDTLFQRADMQLIHFSVDGAKSTDAAAIALSDAGLVWTASISKSVEGRQLFLVHR